MALKSNVAYLGELTMLLDVYPDGADKSLRNDPDILAILNKMKKWKKNRY